MKKIVVLDGYALNPGDLSWKKLEEVGTVKIYDRTRKEDIEGRVGDCEIILTNKTPITRSLLEEKPGIKYIGVLATGYNIVDIEAARDHGVVVTNIPDYGTQAVAQFVFALLLELCSRVGHHDNRVKSGAWKSAEDFCFWDYPLVELTGKTIGIIGYGKIGRATAQIAKAFGMKVLVYDLSPSENSDEVEYVDLDILYERADIISLHCPLTEGNRWMIDSRAINSIEKRSQDNKHV